MGGYAHLDYSEIQPSTDDDEHGQREIRRTYGAALHAADAAVAFRVFTFDILCSR
jgi:hypothetical protein